MPHATVRTRIARGLARLRTDLDAQGENGRQRWAPAICALAASRRTAAATSPLLGTLAMKKLTATLAVLLMLALGLGIAWWPGAAPPPNTNSVQAPGIAAVTLERDDPDDGAPAEPTRREVTHSPTVLATVPVFPGERGFGSVDGILADANGKPMPAIEIRAEPLHGTLPPGVHLRDDRTAPTTVTDALGAFRFERVAAGPTRLRASLEPGRCASRDMIVADGRHEGPVHLRPRRGDIGDDVAIRVLDRNARPVAGALVEVFAWSADERRNAPPADPAVEPLCRGRTDEGGVFAAHGHTLRSGFVFASAADGAQGRTPLQLDGTSRSPSPHEVTVQLRPPGRLSGRLVGLPPQRLDGATISAHAVAREGIQWGGSRRFDARVRDSAFAFDALPSGLYGFTLTSAQGIRLVARPWGHDTATPQTNSALMTVANAPSGGETEIELEVADAAGLRGRVHSGGSPLAGATVRAVYAPRTSNQTSGFVLRGVHVWRFDRSWENCPSDPLTHVATTTDATGRYALPNLQPGIHRVEVLAPGYALERRTEVPIAEGEVLELDHDLPAAGVLQVAGLDLGYVGVTRAGDDGALQIAIANRDFVTFWGLPEGDYDVHRFHSDPSVDLHFLGRAHVEAGRTTWLDLRAASVGGVLTGRVTAAGQPAADALIQRISTSTRTDAFGAFRLENAHPFRLGPSLMSSRLQLTYGGVRSSWILPGEGTAAAVDLPIDLGAHRLTVEATDASGRPATVRLELQHRDGEPESGCDHVELQATVPLTGRTFGPFPPRPLQGRAVFEDGYAAQIEIPSDTETFRITRDAVAALRVTVRKQGQPISGARVFAHRWKGAGAPPDDDREFYDNGEQYDGKTAADGSAEILVPFGHYLVTVNLMFMPGATRRLVVDARTKSLDVELE